MSISTKPPAAPAWYTDRTLGNWRPVIQHKVDQLREDDHQCRAAAIVDMTELWHVLCAVGDLTVEQRDRAHLLSERIRSAVDAANAAADARDQLQ